MVRWEICKMAVSYLKLQPFNVFPPLLLNLQPFSLKLVGTVLFAQIYRRLLALFLEPPSVLLQLPSRFEQLRLSLESQLSFLR